MKLISNIIWAISGGIISALLWVLTGLLLCITVVGIPFGVQCFKFAKLSFAPYGKKVYLDFSRHPIANVIWLFFVGWIMFLVYLISGIFCCITIFGIPSGIQSFKFSILAIGPFGAKVSKPIK